MYYLTKKFSFDAAHHIEHYIGKCANVHGHTWICEVTIRGNKLNSLGILIDFASLKTMLSPIVASLDHQYLNDVCSFNPTAENISKYVYQVFKEKLESYNDTSHVTVYSVKVWESSDSCAEYREE